MNRRELLGALGGAVAIPALTKLSPDGLLALGRATHGRLGAVPLDVLDAHQLRTVTAIAERIIPTTDTPGAAHARVGEFVDVLLADWHTPTERDRFLAGLADVDRRTDSRYGRAFADLAEPDQNAVLTTLDDEVTALRERGGAAGAHFFSQIKWLTLYGYYTSEVGVTLELRYETIPNAWNGCVEIPVRDAGGR